MDLKFRHPNAGDCGTESWAAETFGGFRSHGGAPILGNPHLDPYPLLAVYHLVDIVMEVMAQCDDMTFFFTCFGAGLNKFANS